MPKGELELSFLSSSTVRRPKVDIINTIGFAFRGIEGPLLDRARLLHHSAQSDRKC